MVHKKIIFFLIFSPLSTLVVLHFIFSLSNRFNQPSERRQPDAVFDINNYINSEDVNRINDFLESTSLGDDTEETESVVETEDKESEAGI